LDKAIIRATPAYLYNKNPLVLDLLVFDLASKAELPNPVTVGPLLVDRFRVTLDWECLLDLDVAAEILSACAPALDHPGMDLTQRRGGAEKERNFWP